MSDINTPINRDIIPEPTLRRLPWYLAYMTVLDSHGVEYVSSTRIAHDLDVDPSQIAKDLSYVNIKGKTRIGYEVKRLETSLEQFLGFRRKHNAVVIGAGSLGAALMHDSGLESYGLNIVAGFDIDPRLVGSHINGIEVYDMERLPDIRLSMDIKVGIITVPFEAAQTVADKCMDAGVAAIWNFTPCRIRVRDGVVIQNTSIYSNLAVMFNRLSSIDESH